MEAAKPHLDKAQHWSIASSAEDGGEVGQAPLAAPGARDPCQAELLGFPVSTETFWLLFKAAYKRAAVAAAPASTQDSIL